MPVSEYQIPLPRDHQENKYLSGCKEFSATMYFERKR